MRRRERGAAQRVGIGLATGVGLLLAAPAAFSAAAGFAAPRETLRMVLSETLLSAPALGRTLLVCALVGVLAAGLALPAALWARRSPLGASALLLTPMLLPSSLVYASWGLLRAPGTGLGDWLARGPVWALRAASWTQAIGGLALWSWPLAAIAIIIGSRAIEQERFDWLRLACATRTGRALATLRTLAPSILAGAGLVGLVTLGSAVPLHVAQVETYAIALWRMLDETGGSAAVWASATPLLVIAAVGGWLIAGRLSRLDLTSAPRREAERPGAWTIGAACVVWGLSALAPLALLASSLRSWSSVARFVRDAGEAMASSAQVGLAVGVMGVALGALMSAGRRRSASGVCLWVWIALGLAPGVLLGASLLRAGSAPGLGWMAETRGGVALAHLGRFGFVAVVAAHLARRAEPGELEDLRRLEAGGGLRAWLGTRAMAQAPALLAAGAGMFLLSLHEIESAVTLTPPGSDNLPRFLLNLLHYNRQEELTAGMLVVAGGGLAVALMAAGVIGAAPRMRRRR